MNILRRPEISRLTLLLFAILLLATTAQGRAPAQVFNETYNFTPNLNLPDDNPSGISALLPVSGSNIDKISNLTVDLTIVGTPDGYGATTAASGDISVALVAPDGTYAVLMNRVGVGCNGSVKYPGSGCITGMSGTDPTYTPYGYADNGVSITFSDTAANGDIHSYQSSAGYSVNANGQLTGTWQPDGRDIPDNSTPYQFSAAARTAFLGNINGGANGNWEIFASDNAYGNTGEITALNIHATGTVPAPPSVYLMAAGMTGLFLTRLRARQQQRSIAAKGDLK